MDTNAFSLAGAVAAITGAGANGGVGHALAAGFARAGADLALCDIDGPGLEKTAAEVTPTGRKVTASRCDFSDERDVDAWFLAIDKAFGRVDILVNVPFAFPSRVRPHELSLEAWRKTLAVSLTGYFLCAQRAIRRMIARGNGGVILNIGSIAGATALGRGNMPYSVAKGGVNQLTRELAVEYAGQGIRVNAILPAQIMTPGFKRGTLENPRLAGRIRERLLAGIPQNRLLEPEDLVGPAIFLCSPAAAAVTGALLPVDGGNLALNAGGSHTWPEA